MADFAALESCNSWFYANNGAQEGPISLNELVVALQNGSITVQQQVWCEHLPQWQAASDTPFLMQYMSGGGVGPAPGPSGNPVPSYPQASPMENQLNPSPSPSPSLSHAAAASPSLSGGGGGVMNNAAYGRLLPNSTMKSASNQPSPAMAGKGNNGAPTPGAAAGEKVKILEKKVADLRDQNQYLRQQIDHFLGVLQRNGIR